MKSVTITVGTTPSTMADAVRLRINKTSCDEKVGVRFVTHHDSEATTWIKGLTPGGLMELAGARVNDRLLKINGVPIASHETVTTLFAEAVGEFIVDVERVAGEEDAVMAALKSAWAGDPDDPEFQEALGSAVEEKIATKQQADWAAGRCSMCNLPYVGRGGCQCGWPIAVAKRNGWCPHGR